MSRYIASVVRATIEKRHESDTDFEGFLNKEWSVEGDIYFDGDIEEYYRIAEILERKDVKALFATETAKHIAEDFRDACIYWDSDDWERAELGEWYIDGVRVTLYANIESED